MTKELNRFYNTTSGAWDKAIAFSPKDVATMLNLPLSSIHEYMRKGVLKTFKVGRHYRVTRQSLYDFVVLHEVVVF